MRPKYLRHFVTLFALAAFAAALAFVGILHHLAVRQNEIASELARRQATAVLGDLEDRATYEATNNAVWDEAYARIGVDRDEAWFHSNLGAAQYGVMSHDSIGLVGADGALLMGAWRSAPIAAWPQGVDLAALRSVVSQAARLPGHAFASAAHGPDGPLLLAAAAVCAHSVQGRCARRFLVLVTELEPPVRQAAKDRAWPDLRLEGGPSDRAYLAIVSDVGETVGHLTWDEPRPGYAALWDSMALIVGALLTIGVSVTGLFLRVRRTTRNLKQATQEAQRQAATDALTGIANRRALTADVDLRLAAREAFCLMILDFDGFKEVNDTLGHEFGDELLVEMSRRMRALEPKGGLLARLGGDEFALVVPGGIAEACELGRDVVMTIRQPFDVPGQRITISASVGVAESLPKMAADELFRRADRAMYDAKAERSGAVRVFSPEMDEKRLLLRALEREMRAALEDGQFHVVYQPILRVSDGRVAAVEALLRWEHPTRGLVSPADFIPAAEQSRFIVELGAFALREACARLAARPDLHLSVNLSPVQLLDDRLTERVRAALEETRFDPARLELEVTEGYLISQEERALATLTRLRDELGVRISLDDFGSGYASLGYLRRYPLDKVKIDKSFVDPIDTDPRARQVLLSILELCRAFEIPITVEGVERRSQAEFLAAAGCDYLQGYLLGAPRQEPPAPEPRIARGAA